MNAKDIFINHSPLTGKNKTALGSALASCSVKGFNYCYMEKYKNYLHYQIELFAKRYEGSSSADEIIELKKKVDDWLDKKMRSIQEFYVFENEKIKSYVCKYNTFTLRLIFYRNGESRIVIRHEDVLDSTIKDNEIISEYCLDAGSVYFIESEFGWKIGKTKNIRKRKQEFDVKLPFQYAVRCQIKTHQKSRVERLFHNHFKSRLINGEWFSITREEIEFAALQFPELKLSSYSPDDHIKIKYRLPEELITVRQTLAI